MNGLSKIHFGFCSTMGIYGLSRGIRSDNENNKIIKFKNVLTNGILYSCPIVNIIPTYKLYNRIYLEKNNVLKKDYINQYKEYSGYCFDTY